MLILDPILYLETVNTQMKVNQHHIELIEL